MEYGMYATKIYSAEWFLAPHSYRTYPYPLFLAGMYKLFGYWNNFAVFTVQAVLDASIGLIIYAIVYYGLKKPKEAFIGQLLYTLNPFTSGYVGVLLAEILSAFFIIVTIGTGMILLKTRSIIWAVVFGLIAGLAAETRNAALIWAVIPIGFALFWLRTANIKRFVAAITIGLLMSFIYPLITNWREYREINIMTVDSFFAKEFFNGAVLKRLPPFTYRYPYEVEYMFWEYYSGQHPGRTTQERRQMAAKYVKKTWDIILRDPIDYLKVRFDKMWYMWQKENIFFYVEPGFSSHWRWTYVGNLSLLVLAILGIAASWKRKRSAIATWIYTIMVGSLVYATLVFSISHAEYRITIPFYPIIIAFAAIGIGRITRYEA